MPFVLIEFIATVGGGVGGGGWRLIPQDRPEESWKQQARSDVLILINVQAILNNPDKLWISSQVTVCRVRILKNPAGTQRLGKK